jgi:hypothetical protein
MMSGTTSNGGSVTSTGVGTKEGGLVVVAPGPHGGTTGSVSNQSQLVLDSSIFNGLSQETARELKLVQLAFARAVSAAAVDAYDQIIAKLTATIDTPSPNGNKPVVNEAG